jgi:hypothetical protein
MAKKATYGIRKIKVDKLFLDSENPRLAKSGEMTDDSEILKELYRRYDLKDLLSSLAQHGYFSEEPLIGVPRDSNAETFTIVEGNRRLAALKILLFEDVREMVGVKKLPEIKDGVRKKLNPVPVKVYASREEIVPYLGVRHITGVKPWDSISKAKYIKKLIENDIPIKEVTKIVASRSDVVSRSLLTLYVINQANEITEESWEEEARSFKFSWLYTALGYIGIRNYLGLDSTALEDPKPNPVPENKHKELLHVMEDLYGTPDEKRRPRLSDSRQISKLASIYEIKVSLDAFRAGASLEEAFRKSGGEREQLVELLQEASYKLDEANGIAPHYKKDDEAIHWSKRCYESAAHLVNTLEG